MEPQLLFVPRHAQLYNARRKRVADPVKKAERKRQKAAKRTERRHRK